MQLYDYPACCKAQIYGNFGYGHLNERNMPAQFSKEQIIEDFTTRRLPRLQGSGTQVVVAMPTCHQTEAIAALKELGFVGMKKSRLEAVEIGYHDIPRNEHGNAVDDDWDADNEIVKHQMIPMIFLVPPRAGTMKPDGSHY